MSPAAALGDEAGAATRDGPHMSRLPVEPAYSLAERAEEHRWLVTGLWLEQAVGIVGGEPKCCKSFLALDLAVSVAAGTPCLRRFVVPKAGRVLLYAAEDALHIVRRRLDGIASAAGVMLADLDIQLITVPVLRLDLDADRRNLAQTVERLRPRLLILDPFVRLHRIDENASGEVAPLLAYLRELQRCYGVAVLVVHHANKGAGGVRSGQALCGSSEFHAWGDSNLYLRRDGEELTLTVEHRAAASRRPLAIELAQQGLALALQVVERVACAAVAAIARRAHCHGARRGAGSLAVRRPARPMPGPRRHPARAHHPARRGRAHRQDGRRLPPSPKLTRAPFPVPVPDRSTPVWEWERERRLRPRPSKPSLPSADFLGSAPCGASFIPAAPSARRRAQRRSRSAVAPTRPRAPPPPGRILTVASTTARPIGTGEEGALPVPPIKRRDALTLKYRERAYRQ